MTQTKTTIQLLSREGCISNKWHSVVDAFESDCSVIDFYRESLCKNIFMLNTAKDSDCSFPHPRLDWKE